MYEKPSGQPSKRYGKHSVKYWVVVYVIAAIVVYGLVYWFFIHKSGGSSGTGGYHY